MPVESSNKSATPITAIGERAIGVISLNMRSPSITRDHDGVAYVAPGEEQSDNEA
jgi:hypothetical protein